MVERIRYSIIILLRETIENIKSSTFLRELVRRVTPLGARVWFEKWMEGLVQALDWKHRAQLHYRWDVRNDPDVYSKICFGFNKERFESYADSIVWALNPSRDDICLNIGCGIGRVEKFLSPKVKEIHSVDFASSMIEMARERLKEYPNCHFYKNDGESLDMFPNDMFDLAWAELVFQHIPPEVTKKYVAEVYRVLKKGGRFICQIPTQEKWGHKDRVLCGWMSKAEVMELFDMFDSVEFSEQGGDRYFVPIAIK